MDDHQGAAHEHRGGCLEGRSWALNARRHQNHPKNKLYHFPRFLAARPSVTCNRPKKANIWIIKVLAFRIPLVSLAESIFQYKIVSEIGRVRSPKRRVRDDDFILGLSSECRRIVFLLAEAIQRVSNAILNLKISWQAQYLVRLEGDIACSAHWK